TSDGTTWNPAAPTSFVVRGLASSGRQGAVVAGGNYEDTGRLHASTDGLSWPGFSTEFPQPLNAVTYGSGSFVAVGNGGLIVQSGSSIVGPTNEWTKPDSGYWEEPFWSLGVLPAPDQNLVAFRNPGFKALAIGANTTFNYANSLSIENLLVDAPAGSINQLLLNYAGLSIPLSVHSDFNLGSNASLVSYYSALRGGNLYLSGPAAFSESSQVNFGKIVVGADAPASLSLTNSSLSAIEMIVSDSAASTVTQSGGSNSISRLQMNAGSVYSLFGGTLLADSLDLQSLDGSGLGQFTMSSGYMDVQGPIKLGRPTFAIPDAHGEFLLEGGRVHFAEMDFLNGKCTQTGGTNITERIALPLLDYSRGEYFLSGGNLISGWITMGAVLSPSSPSGSADFFQSGGTHSNSVLQLFGEIRRQNVTHYGVYTLSGGLLASDSMQLIGGAAVQTGGTNRTRELMLVEAASYALTNGQLITSNTTVDTCCCVQSRFVQNGGSHTIQNRLLLTDFVDYRLLAGTVTANQIELGPGAAFLAQGGAISNSGLFTIRGGALRAGGQNLQLGQLQVLGQSGTICVDLQPAGPTLDVGIGGTDGATTLRFRDSHDTPWSGWPATPLHIVHWSPTTNGFGPDHIYVGTNAQGLTAAQVSQIVFDNPIGSPAGVYPAQILSTGEIVPGSLPPVLNFTNNIDNMVLTWSGVYDLLTATNVTGPYLVIPGAASPYTILFTDPQRYFRLRTPVP
ncbi:MAG: hypothetical protein ACTHLW_07430, partial [Verrucomicrobiota bacterium]